jgi:hypothetical protein
MIPLPPYYPVVARERAWMTLRELESLGQWDYFNDKSPAAGFKNCTCYAALAAVGSYGGYARPSNGMDVTVNQIDMDALLGEMGSHGPTPNDGAAS